MPQVIPAVCQRREFHDMLEADKMGNVFIKLQFHSHYTMLSQLLSAPHSNFIIAKNT